ncbi:MAG: asparagine synthase-related protein [Acidimicrobiales bacterium]
MHRYVIDIHRLSSRGDHRASAQPRGVSHGPEVTDRVPHPNARTSWLDDLLPKTDRMSMAHGLEVRSPFLAREVWEFVARLPPDHKVRAWPLQRVLKEGGRDIVPRELLHRRKRGFGVPLDLWFRADLRTYTESMLVTPSARVLEPLRAVWTLLTLEVFLRREDW